MCLGHVPDRPDRLRERHFVCRRRGRRAKGQQTDRAEAENERLQALAEKAWKQADDANNAALKSALRNAELEAQRQEDADLIEAQKREIEVLHGIREEAERLREEVEQLQWVIRDMSNAMEGE